MPQASLFSLSSQLYALARSRADVVFPVPLSPAKKYALGSDPVLMLDKIASDMCGCP